MRLIQKYSRLTIAATGVSLAALVAVALPSTAAYIDDEKKVVEEKKSKSKTVRVISAGKPIVIERSGNRYVVKNKDHSGDHDHHSKKESRTYSFTFDGDEHFGGRETREAMERIEASLEKVEARLEKARKKSEKAALEAARDGLKTAIEALKSARSRGVHTLALGDMANRHAFIGRDLSAMRLNIDGDLGELQEKIEDALGDVELDMELDLDLDIDVEDGAEKNIRVLRLKDGKHHVRHFGMSDEKRLEALKRAEEELKQSREKLEKRLAEKKEGDSKEK